MRYARSFNTSFLDKFWRAEKPRTFIEGLNEASDRDLVYPTYSLFSDIILQNNEVGLHTSYSARLHFKNISIEANQRLKSTPDPNPDQFSKNETTGIEMNHTSNWGHILEDVSVRGYEVGESY